MKNVSSSGKKMLVFDVYERKGHPKLKAFWLPYYTSVDIFHNYINANTCIVCNKNVSLRNL